MNIMPLINENAIKTEGEWLLHLEGHQGTWPGLRAILYAIADESDHGSARQRGLVKLAGAKAVYVMMEHA